MLSIVLPTYNERENIRRLIPAIERMLKQRKFTAEIIVVDDSSPDGTAAAARTLGKQYGNVRTIVRPKKEGIGAALHQGYDAARGDIILSMDVDSLGPETIPKLVNKLKEGYDYVNGDRGTFGSWCSKRGMEGFTKECLSIAGNGLLRLLFGAPLSQFTMNCRAFTRKAWRGIRVQEKGNIFLIEMIVAMKKNKAKITQVPVTFTDRKHGMSKMRLGIESIRFIRVLGRLVWQYHS